MVIIAQFVKILKVILGIKTNQTLTKERAELLNDAAIIKKVVENPTQFTLVDELDNLIENIKLELNQVSISKERQRVLLDRLALMLQMIEKYKDEVPILSSMLSTIIFFKLTYLEKHADSFSSDEILNAIENNQLFIQRGNYEKQIQRIRKKVLLKKLNRLSQDKGLLWFKQQVDIENMTLVEINVFFDGYHGKNIPSAQEIIRLGKQKMLALIRQEIASDTIALVRTYPWLKELLLEGGKINLIGKGKSGIVLESTKSNTVIKIYHSGNIDDIRAEVKNHADFWDAIEYGKLAKTINGNPCIPDWIQVPDVYQIPNPTAIDVWERTYLMGRVRGMTLKRWVYLKRDEYRSKLKPFTEQEIQNLSEIEFEKLLEKRNLLHYFVYHTSPLKIKNELLPIIFFKAFENKPEKTKRLQQALEYLRDEHQLVHNDLHWKNILIDEQGEIYLIDFAP